MNAVGDTVGASAPAPAAVVATDAAPRVTATHGHLHHAPASLGKLAFGALGIVYGDIGTSPLYAVKECVTMPHGVGATAPNVLGLLSLIFWSLTFVVSIKYLFFVMRADNEGEGGVLALMALVAKRKGSPRGKMTTRLVLLGLFGAALLYGDGVITPAISVLSAVEGLEVATSTFTSVVVPLTCLILVALFWAQKGGTSRIAAVFAPVTLLWFLAIAAAGLPWIARAPSILGAVNPVYAARFFAAHGLHGFLVLGSVVLCVTGGEALYADMGHFGTPAIRRAWILCVFPSLLINYFGQGALLLARPAAAENPFYALFPAPVLIPMVVLATAATVGASQALISGVFSLTRQAVQLGYLPRVTVVHTSARTEGQIYIPEVNWLLMAACVLLVLAFKESSRLAAAYGIAVTGTMGITSVLFAVHARQEWGWSRLRAGALLVALLAFDLSFFAACSAKIANGGWFPLLVATAVFVVMTTWKAGRARLAARLDADSLPLETFLDDLEAYNPHRVAGTAVFLTSIRRGTPSVLLRHFKHNKSLHAQVILLSIVTDAVPEVEPDEIVHLKEFGLGFWGVTAHYGFMQSPDALEIVRGCAKRGLVFDLASTSFYVGRETLIASTTKGFAPWRRALFRFLSRNARSATEFFAIPPNRVVEIGAQIEF
jgi:KUP system potassium uptake protein